MDLASAYKRIDQQQNSVKLRTTLAIKANASVLDVFKQAVNLIDSDKWLAGGPREIKREDYYCYLHFANDNDCIRAIKSKSKPQIHSVERAVTCNDIFQYKNKNGELDVYVRPAGGQESSFFKITDCYDDKSAMSRFVSYLPDEKAIMSNLCGEQEYVTFGYHSNIGSDKDFSIVLFRDGNAYYYERPTIGIQYNAYNFVGDLEYRLNREKEDYLVNNIANSVHNINTFKSMYAIKPPIEKRTSILGFKPGFYIDYSVFTRKSYPVLYHTPDDNKSSYKNSGLCSYCGGTFEGSFIKKCMICGKKKDY